MSSGKLSTISAVIRQAINHISCHRASFQSFHPKIHRAAVVFIEQTKDLISISEEIWGFSFYYTTFYLIALFLGMSYISRIATLSRTPSGQTALKPLWYNRHHLTNLADLLEPFPNFFFIVSCICFQVLYVILLQGELIAFLFFLESFTPWA